MAVAAEIIAANLSTPQSKVQPKPNTIASAATVAPVHRFTRITGTTPITTITPPADGYHQLTFIFTSAFANAFNTGGNINAAYTSVADRPVTLHYDPRTALYYVMTVT